MNLNAGLQLLFFFVVLLLLVKPLGGYMAAVFEGKPTFMSRVLAPCERFLYRTFGIDPAEGMHWKTYAFAFLFFSGLGIAFLYLLQRLQGVLPFNPARVGPVEPALALNTAVSFVSNTNWQNYAGEQSMSYLTQMLGLAVQNFLSAAAGMALLAAFMRAFAHSALKTLGNFWVDLTRSVLYILLPLSLVLALLLVWQGSVQTFSAPVEVNLVDPFENARGETITSQTITLGPVASQVAIKHLGTNGGGFFNANAAHPFENPTPLSNLLLMLAQTLIPAALPYTFGKLVGDTRQGWAILAAMLVLLVAFSSLTVLAEAGGNPLLTQLGINQQTGDLQPGGNMLGKEVRFGIAPSALFATLTTATSCGAVNSMHDSFTPLGGLVAMLMMQLGEVVLGGVGSGLYGMLVFVLVAVFVAGLMVGRTPEYLGKKIEPFEMKMAALLILIMPLTVLGLTALAVSLDAGRAGITNPGPHGFSQVLYAFSSMGNNNGSAFGGLSGNTLFYNLSGILAMVIARFGLAIPTLALAGSLAGKKIVPAGAGTLPTSSFLFIVWVMVIVIVVGALNFIPALALGPVIEHLLMIGA